jgi:dTDP-4-amino-4,6-dideoxygalactose transaminase
MTPQLVEMIPVARPVLGEMEIEAIRRVILSGWVTQGPEVAAFEEEFADFVGAAHAVAVSNCTTALHLALRAVGVSQGDEVITVSHSFIATANAIHHCGATPVFVDVETGTWNMDPALIEAAITPRTRAILCVHQLGMPCDLKRIVKIGDRHGLPVVEDAACATGSEILWRGKWERVGRPHGVIACFSFHPRKVITTGDGGMITTADPELARKVRLWRQHSMSVTDTVRHAARDVVFESYNEPGFNYRMTDLQAAVGRVQLSRLEELVADRRLTAAEYGLRLETVPGVTPPVEPAWAHSNWQSYEVQIPVTADQRQVMQFLLEHGIATRRGVMNAHLEKPYRSAPRAGRLTNSERGQRQGIILPLVPGMSPALVQNVCDHLALALKAAA